MRVNGIWHVCFSFSAFFPRIVDLFDLKCNLYIKKEAWDYDYFFALGELFIVVRYFVDDVTRRNTLPQDVQLPHYCISKYVALRDILAVTNVGPLILSTLFTVNKVVYCKSDVCILSAILSSLDVYLSYLVNFEKSYLKKKLKQVYSLVLSISN